MAFLPEDRHGVMRLSHRLVAMHIAGVAILVLVVLTSVSWISAEHNRLALHSSERMVEAGIAASRARLRTLVRDYSIWDEAYAALMLGDREWLYRNIGNAAAEIGTLDMIVFLPTEGESFGWLHGSPRQGIFAPLPDATLAALEQALVSLGSDSRAAATLFAEFDGEPWVFSITHVIPVDGLPPGVASTDALPLQVHGQRLAAEWLAIISRNLPTEVLALADVPAPEQASIALRDSAGNILTHVAWHPPRPGASILRRVALPLGLALLLIVVVTAVSSRNAVRSARRLERALHDAQAADRLKTEFLSNVSHELRTPMNGVLGVAQLLETTSLDDEQRELVQVLHTSATAQMSLISDLLDISRMEDGNRQIVIEPFVPASVLADVGEMIRLAAAKRGIAFAADLADVEGIEVRGDGRAFRQIVTNLLGNAVKFTDAGGVVLAACGERIDDRIELVVTVSDTGRGIPAEALPHIFERFYQVDSSLTRGVEGTGLGLAISQSLARLMSGRIEVASEPGRGSSFTFSVGFEAIAAPDEERHAA